jgi:hypothetical protein
MAILSQVLARIAFFAFWTHGLYDFPGVLGVDTETVESDLEDISVQVFFWKLIIVNEEVSQLKGWVFVAR